MNDPNRRPLTTGVLASCDLQWFASSAGLYGPSSRSAPGRAMAVRAIEVYEALKGAGAPAAKTQTRAPWRTIVPAPTQL